MPRRRRAPLRPLVFPDVDVKFRRLGAIAPIVFHCPIVSNVEGVDQMDAVYRHFALSKLNETRPWIAERLMKSRKKRLHTRKRLIARRLFLIAARRKFWSLKLRMNRAVRLTREEYDQFDKKFETLGDTDFTKNLKHRFLMYLVPTFSDCLKLHSEIETLEMFLFLVGTVLINLIPDSQVGLTDFNCKNGFLKSVVNIREQLSPQIFEGCIELLSQLLVVLRQFNKLTDAKFYPEYLQKMLRSKNCRIVKLIEKCSGLLDIRITRSVRRKLCHVWKTRVLRSDILHGLAIEAEKRQNNNQVLVTKKEMASLENAKVDGEQKLVEIRTTIEELLEENKKLIFDNVQFELRDKLKDIQKLVHSSYQYVQQKDRLKKLKIERQWWLTSCKRRSNRSKNNFKPAFYWSDKIKGRISQVSKEVPEHCKKKIESAVATLNKLEELKYETAERKQLRTHFASKLRYTWLEHHENMVISLKEDKECEIEHMAKKQEVLNRIKKDLSEGRFYYYRSFTIPFSLPKRLQPPFPVSVMDFRPQKPMILKPIMKPIVAPQEQLPQIHFSIPVPFVKPQVKPEIKPQVKLDTDSIKRSNDKIGSQQSHEPSSRNNLNNRKIEESSFRRRSRSPRRLEKEVDKRRIEKSLSSSSSRYEPSFSRYRDEPSSSSRYRENERDRRRRDEPIDMRRDRYEDERDRNRKRKVEERVQRPRSRSGDRIVKRERKYSDEDLRKKLPSIVVKKQRYDETTTPSSCEQRREYTEDLKYPIKEELIEKKFSPKDMNLKEITPSPEPVETNLPNPIVFYSFFNLRDLKASLSQIPSLGFDTFVKFILPNNLLRPINIFSSYFRVTVDESPRELPEEKYENKILILMEKYFLKYVQNECAIQITLQADVDFLSQEVYPFEIARQIIHNYQSAKNHKKNGESNRNYLPKIYKAKFAVAQGMMNLLKKEVETINTIYEIEDQLLFSIKDQTRVKNAMDFARRHVKYLTKVDANLKSIINALKTMKQTHETYQQYKAKQKTNVINRLNILQKKKSVLESAKEKFKTENEEKRKKLSALRRQYVDTGEECRRTCVSYSEADVELTRKKMILNIIQEDNRRANLIESRLDIITKAVYKKYKDMLFCSSCKLRKKNCALTKCWHIFCDECIQTLIKTRNRKCPECGARFGLNEFKKVYIE